jgi:zinc transport system substrate-binding protein
MISRMFSFGRLPFVLCLLLAALALPAAAAPAPVLAASIKPLQLLAAAITDGVSEPQLVLAAAEDPHHAALRPSQRRALQAADLVLWTGPLLEVPLADVIAALPVPVVTASELTDVVLLDAGGTPDPHLWLDSRNARAMAAALAATLQQLDPGSAARYAANLQALLAGLDRIDARIDETLAPWRQRPWAVSHQAFAYFTRQHGLREPLTLANTANAEPGVRSAVQLNARIAAEGIACLVIEPTESGPELASLLAAPGLHIATADVLGQALAPGAAAYGELLLALGEALRTCLGATHD